MKKNVLISYSALAMVAFLTVGCGAKRFAMYSPEETNLQSLNKITDNEDNKFGCPFGGDRGQNLFFAVRDKRGSSNIYRKDNPIAAAMSPKTEGRNFNTAPTFCAATNLLAYAGRQEGAFLSDIYMLDITQGAAIRRVTNTPSEIELHPCLSADGSSIVYEKRLAGAGIRDAQVWRQDLRTESPTLLCQGMMPSFSHDNRYIVFVRCTADGENTCLVNKSYDAEPYWANDGYIYFSSDRGGLSNNFQIWRFQYGRRHAYSQSYTAPAPAVEQPMSYPNQNVYTGIYHTVKSGETITEIARRYNISVRDVVKWNKLTTMTITEGMKLKVSAQ